MNNSSTASIIIDEGATIKSHSIRSVLFTALFVTTNPWAGFAAKRRTLGPSSTLVGHTRTVVPTYLPTYLPTVG